MKKDIDYSGIKFGKLTILENSGRKVYGKWNCLFVKAITTFKTVGTRNQYNGMKSKIL